MDRKFRLGSAPLMVAAMFLGEPSAILNAQAPMQISPLATISGRVVNAGTRQPIASAQVHIPELALGVLSQANGRYLLLNVPAGAHTVLVQLIGYRTASQTVTVGPDEAVELDFNITEQALVLDRLVVTGTVGETLQRSLGHAVGTIAASEIVRRTEMPGLTDLLNGREQGVVIMGASGMAGAGPRINIRGTSSLSLRGEPLLYVDGIRVNNDIATGPQIQGFGAGMISRLNDFSPEDIESVEIIKGPAAATLYGTEAMNGVIQIITKRGRTGRPVLDFRMGQGAQWLHNIAERFPTNYQRDVDGTLVTRNRVADLIEAGNSPFRTGRSQSYGMSVRGGSSDVLYYAAFNLDREEGVNRENASRRYSGRLNLTMSPSSSLEVTTALGFGTGRIDLFRETSIWSSFYNARPLLKGTPQDRRPPDIIDKAFEDFQKYQHLTGSLQLRHTPVPWFSQRLVLGGDVTGETNERIIERMDAELLEYYSGATTLGSKSREDRTITIKSLDYNGTLSYEVADDLVLRSTVGTQYYTRLTDILQANGREFPVRGVDVISAAGTTFGGGDFVENSTLGFYVQEQLAWKNRIFFTAAMRGDDNSAFGKDYDFVTYPKASAAWVLSEEDFWNVGFVDAFRLRAAFGAAGQQPETFAALRTYRPISSGDGGSAVSPQFIGNPDLGPERSSEVEVGFEASLLNERIGLDVTYYNSTTSDGIIERPMAPSSGFAASQFLNLAKIKKQGVELDLRTHLINTERFGWDVDLRLGWNSSEIKDLGDVMEIPLQGGSVTGVHAHRIGFSPGSFFWFDIVSQEIGSDGTATNVMCDGGTGKGGWEKGGTPVPCDQAPKVFQGVPTPRYDGSLFSQFRFGENLRLSAMVDFKGSYSAYNFSEFHWCRSASLCLERNDPTSPLVDPKRVAMLADPVLQIGYGIHDQSFAKLREVSLTYSIPDTWLRGTGIQRAGISVSARNLATWTNWPSPGLDPESSFTTFESDPLHARFEWRNTPHPRRFMTTIRLSM